MNRRVRTTGAAYALLGSALLASSASANLPQWIADIYEGSCPGFGGSVGIAGDADIAGTLVGVSDSFPVDGVGTATGYMGSDTAISVEASVTSAVPIAFGDLFATPHAIVVHGAAVRSGSIKDDILCGDIGDDELGATDLVMGLGSINDSPFTGIAMIHDNGDSTIMVAIYMTTGLPAEPPTGAGGPSIQEPSPSP